MATDVEVFRSGRDALSAMIRAAEGAQTMLIGVAYITSSGLDELLPHMKIEAKQ